MKRVYLFVLFIALCASVTLSAASSGSEADSVGGSAIHNDLKIPVNLAKAFSISKTSKATGIKNPRLIPHSQIAITTETASQQRPAVSVDVNGIASIAWEDYRHGNWEIYFCRVDRDMQFVVNPMRLTNTSASSDHVRIDTDAVGNTYLVWEEGSNVYYAKIDASGVILVTPLSVGSGTLPALATNSDGKTGIVWEFSTTMHGTKFQLRNSSGSTVTTITLRNEILNTDNYCTIDNDPAGNFFVFRREVVQYNVHYFLAKVTPTGTLAMNGSWFQTTSTSKESCLAMVDTSHLWCYFVDKYNYGATNYYSLYDTNEEVAYNFNGDSRYPSIVNNPLNSDMLMLWEINSGNSGNYDLLATTSINGVVDTHVINSQAYSTRFPSVSCFPDGSYCFVWQDDSAGNNDIHFAICEPFALAADFSAAPTAGSSPLTVNFSDLSNGYPNTWLWEFGDGTTSNEQNPAHVYESSGAYSVTLTIGNGANQDSKTIYNMINVDNVAIPELTGLSVIQRGDESRIVDIYYHVAHTGLVTISLQVSDDGGQTWEVPCFSATHDIGTNISPGRGKRIEWDVLADEIGGIGGLLTFKITASDNLAGSFLISDEVEIFVDDTVYSDYRIVPVALAPNPAVLDIPQGGTGYAWFALEGYDQNSWRKIMNADLTATDAQGNPIPCETRRLPYQFLPPGTRRYLPDAGLFCVPIPYAMIGSGQPDDQETITVTHVGTFALSWENRQSIVCKVVPYEYAANWGYRIFSEVGGGISLGLSLTGFTGGGTGAEFHLPLQGFDAVPDWSDLRIRRRDDRYLGASLGLRAEDLIALNLGEINLNAQKSFPYEKEYRLNLEDGILDAEEASLALYLYMDPYTALVNKLQDETFGLFIGSLLTKLMEHPFVDNLDSRLVSDEAGLDYTGGISATTNLLGHTIGLQIGPSIGTEAHLGAGIKRYANEGDELRKTTIGSKRYTTNTAGISSLPFSLGCEYFYPDRLFASDIPTLSDLEFELEGARDSGIWRSTTLSSSYTSDAPGYDYYNLPGTYRKTRSWVKISDPTVRSLIDDGNSSGLIGIMEDIGVNEIELIANRTKFSDSYAQYLNRIKLAQSKGKLAQAEYGYSHEDIDPLAETYNFTLSLPKPLVVSLKTGTEGKEYREYDTVSGSWIKGYPLFRTEMNSLPHSSLSFEQVIETLKSKANLGGNQTPPTGFWYNLLQLLMDKITDVFIIPPILHNDRTTEVFVLNDYGSSLSVTDNTIPAGADTVLSRFWEWMDEPPSQMLTQRQRDDLRSYYRNLRRIREEVHGMRYGIGGFFRFEAAVGEWDEDPLIKIYYSDAEVADIDESTLGLFWKDAEGDWYYLNSIVVPDSNYVVGYLPYIATYTLAPRLPQGDFGLNAAPDSLLADGISTAVLSSGILHNNDGTVVANGLMYTVFATRGTILTADADPVQAGIQVQVNGGVISFTLQSDQIVLPIRVHAVSSTGYSAGSILVSLYSTQPPQSPALLVIQPEHRALALSWEPSATPGVVGYRIYYDNDSPAPPFTGTSNVDGFDSPVVVGPVTSYTISGLYNEDTYYVAITSVDASGRESQYSNVLAGQPSLRPVLDVCTEITASGIKLGWSPVVGAQTYKVYRGQNPDAPISLMTLVGQTNSLTWVDNDSGSSKMFYRIIAIGY